MNPTYKQFADRLVSYCAVDTGSDPEKVGTFPSTENQWNLANKLVDELKAFGIEPTLTKDCVVYGVLRGNPEKEAMCFVAHMDTAHDAQNWDVKPMIHTYSGSGAIELPLNGTVIPESDILKTSVAPEGDLIVTSSGDTLLGADDKAGITVAMEILKTVTEQKLDVPDIWVVFTPDEEIGQGAANFPYDKVEAKRAITIDGTKWGDIDIECFTAFGFKLNITGITAHPSVGKSAGMQSALWAGRKFLASLPEHEIPEETEGREPFIYVTDCEMSCASASINGIVRSFDMEGIENLRGKIEAALELTKVMYPKCQYDYKFYEQYRNMREYVPESFTKQLVKAHQSAGIEPKLISLRAGTDGSQISLQGLPCPNISTGAHNIHSIREFCSAATMLKIHEICMALLAQ